MGDPKLAAQEPTSDVAHWPRDIKETESAVHRPWARISTASGGVVWVPKQTGRETEGAKYMKKQSRRAAKRVETLIQKIVRKGKQRLGRAAFCRGRCAACLVID